MEHSQKIKTSSAVVIIVLVLFLGYILLTKYHPVSNLKTNTQTDTNPSNQFMKVELERTPMVNNTLGAPAGFPQSIPLEQSNITESVTTNFPELKAKQLSLTYQSVKTVTQKYAEYKNYLTTSGYQITEGSSNSPVRAIFGTKTEANLSVAISSVKGQTIVQISYLLKSL